MIGWILTAISIFIVLVYLLGMYCIHKANHDKYEEWDALTVTISDYTVRYKIPFDLWDNFTKHYYAA